LAARTHTESVRQPGPVGAATPSTAGPVLARRRVRRVAAADPPAHAAHPGGGAGSGGGAEAGEAGAHHRPSRADSASAPGLGPSYRTVHRHLARLDLLVMHPFAFLDDHSRAVVGHRWGYSEDSVGLAAALRPALAARGVPEGVYVDNGALLLIRPAACDGPAGYSSSSTPPPAPPRQRENRASLRSQCLCVRTSVCDAGFGGELQVYRVGRG